MSVEATPEEAPKKGVRWSANALRIYTVLAVAGILVAAYHAYSELTDVFTGCNLTKHISCGLVWQTGYTTIVIGHTAVPFWLLGVVWFPLMTIAGLLLWNRSKLLMVPLILIGDMFTIYLWYVDIDLVWPAVHAICPVCVSLYCVNYALTGIVVASVYSDTKMMNS